MRKTPAVLGVLSMVFGGLVAAWSLFGLVLQPFFSDFTGSFAGAMSRMQAARPGAPDPMAAMQAATKVMEELRPYSYLMSGSMLALSLVLTGVGYGLYRRRAWSRLASCLWALAALAYIPFQLYLQIRVIQPRTMTAMAAAFAAQQDAAQVLGAMGGMQSGITIFMHILIWAPFPIVLLALMGRPSAKSDLHG